MQFKVLFPHWFWKNVVLILCFLPMMPSCQNKCFLLRKSKKRYGICSTNYIITPNYYVLFEIEFVKIFFNSSFLPVEEKSNDLSWWWDNRKLIIAWMSLSTYIQRAYRRTFSNNCIKRQTQVKLCMHPCNTQRMGGWHSRAISSTNTYLSEQIHLLPKCKNSISKNEICSVCVITQKI